MRIRFRPARFQLHNRNRTAGDNSKVNLFLEIQWWMKSWEHIGGIFKRFPLFLLAMKTNILPTSSNGPVTKGICKTENDGLPPSRSWTQPHQANGGGKYPGQISSTFKEKTLAWVARGMREHWTYYTDTMTLPEVKQSVAMYNWGYVFESKLQFFSQSFKTEYWYSFKIYYSLFVYRDRAASTCFQWQFLTTRPKMQRWVYFIPPH